MDFKDFVDGLSKNQKYLIGFYALCVLILLLTGYLITRQEMRVQELRELNAETWEI